ncbi:MAG: hypothetical protein LBT41_04095 [Candidatus Methanoplasma sp.]|nr:hypothetical protein [Candidatus Methanoplasma sp.]
MSRFVLLFATAVAVVAIVGTTVILMDNGDVDVQDGPGIGSKYVYEAGSEHIIISELVGIGDEYVLSLGSVLPKDAYIFIDRETGDVFLAGEPERDGDVRTWTVSGVRVSVAKVGGEYNIIKIGARGETYTLNLEKSTIEKGGASVLSAGETLRYEASADAELSYSDPTLVVPVMFHASGQMTVTAKAAAADGKRIFFTEYDLEWTDVPAELSQTPVFSERNGLKFYIAEKADKDAILDLYRTSDDEFGQLSETTAVIKTFDGGRVSVKQYEYLSGGAAFVMRVGEKDGVLYEAEVRLNIDHEGAFTASVNLIWVLKDHSL